MLIIANKIGDNSTPFDHLDGNIISMTVPQVRKDNFIKVTPENPVLWTGMKGVSAKGRKNLNQMLKRY
jgi:hypothetical protein